MSLISRYDDAYLVAHTVDAAGRTVKVVGLVVAALIALGGFAVVSKLDVAFGFGFAGLLVGALAALPFYALGVLVSAQAQILKATLDTAVNTSPLLSRDEIRQILTRSGGSDDGTALRPQRDPKSPDGHCPDCGAPFWYADYRQDAQTLLCTSCRTVLPRPSPAV
jgi:hypothetical protein